MSASLPERLAAGNGLTSVPSGCAIEHASFVVVVVPVRTSGIVPEVGGAGAAAAVLYPKARSSGAAVKNGRSRWLLSNEPTPITLRPTPGAAAEYTPNPPSLPLATTTITPASTSASAPTALGYCGHDWKPAPMLMLTTFMPSSRA